MGLDFLLYSISPHLQQEPPFHFSIFLKKNVKGWLDYEIQQNLKFLDNLDKIRIAHYIKIKPDLT